MRLRMRQNLPSTSMYCSSSEHFQWDDDKLNEEFYNLADECLWIVPWIFI